MKHKDLTIATILLLVSLAINVTTVLRVVNRPIETVVIHKADNAVELHGKVTGKSMVGKLYTLFLIDIALQNKSQRPCWCRWLERGGNKAHKLNLFISLNTEPKKIKKDPD